MVVALQKSPLTQAMPQISQLYNSTANTVAYGTLLYITGWNVANGRFTFALADNDVAAGVARFVAMEDILTATVGDVAPLDQLLTGILDTSAGAVGDNVYLGDNGLMTLTSPTGANRVEIVGKVTVVSATVGAVQLLPQSIITSTGAEQGDLAVTGTGTFTSASANAFTVGRLGATTPAFRVNASAATSITGVSVTSAAAGGGVAVAAIGETNVALTIDAAGNGTVTINGTGTGAITLGRATGVTGAVTITSAGAAALSVGRQGATDPALAVDASPATQVTGILVTGRAAGAGASMAVQGGNAAEDITIDAKGAGLITLNATGTGVVRTTRRFRTGLAGTATGGVEILGTTSGTVTVSVAAAAGTWTMQLPAAVGTAGFQLTDAAGDGVCTWAAAGSLREFKNVLGEFKDYTNALSKVLSTPLYRFHYKPGMGTGDVKTEYVGVMADEAPEFMHFNGKIVNPVNTLGLLMAAIKGLDQRMAAAGI